MLFHDAVERPFMNFEPGVAQLLEEIERDAGARFDRLAGAGSIAHFVRGTSG
jgi:hypothetical protein